MKTRPDPIFNSELLAAYRAVHPLLLQEQRPRIGAIVCTLTALLAGLALGNIQARYHLTLHGINGAMLGLLCGGTFRLAGRPMEMRWRIIAVAAALFGVVVCNLSWSYLAADGWHSSLIVRVLRPGTSHLASAGAVQPGLDLFSLTLAAWVAWYFSYRTPTQRDIIQRARQLAITR